MPWMPETIDSQILAIHAALLSTNEILYFGGDQHYAAALNDDFDHTRLFHVVSKTITPVSSLTTDVFCSGHAFLGDGRLLVGGGTKQWGTDPPQGGGHGHGLNFGGERACWLFDPSGHTWKRIKDMNPEPGRAVGGGRWYPTLITLPDGDVLAVFGHPHRDDSRHRNHTPERYSPSEDNWTLRPAIATAEDPGSGGPALFYPRLHVLPSGRVFFATPVPLDDVGPNPPYHNRVYDLLTGAFTSALILPPPENDPSPDGNRYRGWYSTSILLPLLPGDGYRPRVMVCGYLKPFRIELGSASPLPKWEEAGARSGAAAGRLRPNLCAVLLPTGDVFLSGGCSELDPEVPVLEGEIYSPGIDWDTLTYTTGAETWVSTEPATVPRNYHSVALLMPNGRVWTAGSSKNADAGPPETVAEKRIEIFKPAYDIGGDWEPWRRIDPSSTPGRTVARRSVVWPASRNPDRLDIFVVGHDGGIYTSGRNTGGDWEPWHPIGDPAAGHTVPAADEDEGIPNSVVSAVARDPDRLDIFVVGHNEGIYTTGQDAGGDWEPWQSIGNPDAGHTVPHRSVVWPASRNQNRLDIFVVGHNGGIYTSGQDSDPTRPKIIGSPNGITYGEAFEVRTLTDRQAATISRVALIRAGSVTHAFDADQRYVALRFEKVGGNRLRVTAPPHAAIAPPGMYMLWILTDRGLPCHLARFVRVSSTGEMPPPPVTGVDSLAVRLLSLAAQLYGAGRTAEAPAPAQAAADVLRGIQPPPEAEAAHWRLFGWALHNLASYLLPAGRADEAVAAAAEAVQAYRRAAAASGADVPWVANQLLGLAAQLYGADRKAEAVAPAQAAADVLRGLQPPPEAEAAHWRLFGWALHNLVSYLIPAGRIDEAVGPAEEAVAAYRRAASVSGADVTGIANQLLSLAAQLANAGLNAESAAAAQAAADVRQ